MTIDLHLILVWVAHLFLTRSCTSWVQRRKTWWNEGIPTGTQSVPSPVRPELFKPDPLRPAIWHGLAKNNVHFTGIETTCFSWIFLEYHRISISKKTSGFSFRSNVSRSSLYLIVTRPDGRWLPHPFDGSSSRGRMQRDILGDLWLVQSC